MGDATIQVTELSRTFPLPGGTTITAVDQISFEVESGTVFGLLGANGAGKTTAMRMLATLVKPSGGSARVCGFDVVEQPGEVRRRVGYLSASSGLPTRVTCREVLALFAGLQHLPAAEHAVERAIERFGIEDFSEQRIETLSTGMRQRVRIACAAIHEPPVLVVDEPTAGLDVVASDRLLDSLLAARDRGTTVVFSTHVLREAERICDRIAIIDEGRLVRSGTVAELQHATATDSLEGAFVATVRR